MQIEKELLDYSTFKEQRTFRIVKQGGEEFKEEEEELAAQIAYGVYAAGAAGAATLVSSIKNANGSTDRMIAAIDDYAQDFKEIAAEGTTLAKNIEKTVDKTIKKAANTYGSAEVVEEFAEKLAIKNGLVKSTKHYTNEFFESTISPRLYTLVEKYSDHKDEALLIDKVEKLISKNLLQEAPYWKVVSNANISRAHQYGVLKSASKSGYSGYIIRAVIDNRTTEICQNLNGREFWISDGLALLENIVSADETTIKDVAPWVTTGEEVEGKTTDELKAQNHLVPPFHANCRSQVIPMR
jgi:hypothetical protein